MVSMMLKNNNVRIITQNFSIKRFRVQVLHGKFVQKNLHEKYSTKMFMRKILHDENYTKRFVMFVYQCPCSTPLLQQPAKFRMQNENMSQECILLAIEY